MSKKLLLADDSVVIQKLVGLSFASEDVEIIATDNGDDAVEMVAEVQPDVVLADVVMPGKSGYEVCEAIKQNPALAHTPVLLLTGTFEAFDEARAASAGADGQITKPFEARALVERVNEVIRTASAQPAAARSVLPPAAPIIAELPERPAESAMESAEISDSASSLDEEATHAPLDVTPNYPIDDPFESYGRDEVDPATEASNEGSPFTHPVGVLTGEAEEASERRSDSSSFSFGGSSRTDDVPAQDATVALSPDAPPSPSSSQSFEQEDSAQSDSDIDAPDFDSSPLFDQVEVPRDTSDDSLFGAPHAFDPAPSEEDDRLMRTTLPASRPRDLDAALDASDAEPGADDTRPPASIFAAQDDLYSTTARDLSVDLPPSFPGLEPSEVESDADQDDAPGLEELDARLGALLGESTASSAETSDRDFSNRAEQNREEAMSPLVGDAAGYTSFSGGGASGYDISTSDLATAEPAENTESEEPAALSPIPEPEPPHEIRELPAARSPYALDSTDAADSSSAESIPSWMTPARADQAGDLSIGEPTDDFAAGVADALADSTPGSEAADPSDFDVAADASSAPLTGGASLFDGLTTGSVYETGSVDEEVDAASDEPFSDSPIVEATSDELPGDAFAAAAEDPEPVIVGEAIDAGAPDLGVVFASSSSQDATDLREENRRIPDLSPMMEQQIQETLEKVAWEAFSDLSESIVKQVIGRVEQIAWEVIPEMAETLVREEIRKMKGDDD